MALKQFNPITPGTRQLVIVDRSGLYKGKPVKRLTEGLTKAGGRNNTGRITARRRGGGHKKTYRIVDFKRRKLDVEGTVARLEYDPNRTAFIALIDYKDGEQAYILAPQRLAVGDKIVSSEGGADVKPGNAMPLQVMPVGTIVHNVEMKPGKGGQIARSAGTYVQLVGRDAGMAILRLNSGEQRLVPWRLLCDDRCRIEPRSRQHQSGQGGSSSLARQAPERSRRRDEPGRSPAWRRRGSHVGRPSPGDAVGQADQGREDPVQQADRQVHHALAPSAQEAQVVGPATARTRG